MDTLIKILVVEDEMIIGAKISMQLTNLGYEVTGILPRGEEAIIHAEENKPDIAIVDIHLKGKLDGVETALQMQKRAVIPIIYLTANSDEATFNRAKVSKPYAFISKPYKQLDLQRAIELTISRMAENETGPQIEDSTENTNDERPLILSDRIFVRHREKMIKIIVAEILYIEADRNYCRIFTKNKEYLLSITLKTIEEKLSGRIFLRTHRSYLINLAHVDEVADGHVIIDQKAIPLSGGLKEQLLQRIQTL
ncbi:MAG: LytTR family transcriptional regulator DNA-binding domain-containing protein [Chitinophagaceae bacterium]|nr:LytTR family transcriptional regulator DNA-binding domain-containing protein [Chitinophagaceae bacterium]